MSEIKEIQVTLCPRSDIKTNWETKNYTLAKNENDFIANNNLQSSQITIVRLIYLSLLVNNDNKTYTNSYQPFIDYVIQNVKKKRTANKMQS